MPVAGKSGPRGRDFNMRWIASLVAETHRILMRGGVFMYPRDRKDLDEAGPPAPAVRSQPDRLYRRAGRRTREHGLRGDPRRQAREPASAHRLRVRRARRSRTDRALSPRAQRVPSTKRHCSARAVCSRINRGLQRSNATMSAKHPIIAVTGSSGRRHHLGHAHVRADLPPRRRERRLRRRRQLSSLRPRRNEEQDGRGAGARRPAGSVTSAPEANLFEELEALFQSMAIPGGAGGASTCTTKQEAAPYGQPAGHIHGVGGAAR